MIMFIILNLLTLQGWFSQYFLPNESQWALQKVPTTIF